MSTNDVTRRLFLWGLALVVVLELILVWIQLSPPAQTSPGGADLTGQVASSTRPTPTPTPTTSPTPATTATPTSTRTATTPAGTATATQSATTTDRPRHTIELRALSRFAQPFQTVQIRGRYVGRNGPTTLSVQREQHGTWLDFPLPATTDRSGNFNAYVELGQRGRQRLRVVDPQASVVSNVVSVYIR